MTRDHAELARQLLDAIARLRGELVACSSLLDRPFTDAPDQTPWMRVERRLLAVMTASTELTAGLSPAADHHARPAAGTEEG